MMSDTKKYKALVSIIIFLLITNFAMLLFFIILDKPADKRAKERTENGMFSSLQKDVGFSKEQLDQYQSLRTVQRKTVKPLFEKVRQSKLDFYDLLYMQNVSDSTLANDADSIAQTQKELDLQMFHHFKRVRGICTADQLQKYDSTIKKVIIRMTGRPGKGK